MAQAARAAANKTVQPSGMRPLANGSVSRPRRLTVVVRRLNP